MHIVFHCGTHPLRVLLHSLTRWRLKLREHFLNPVPGQLVPDDVVVSALVDVCPGFRLNFGNSYVCCHDTSDIPEPRLGKQRVHTGLHPELFGEMVENHFKRHFPKTINAFIKARSLAVRDIDFVVVDRMGRYGALAYAKMLAEIALTRPSHCLLGITTMMIDSDFVCTPCEYCKFWDKSWRFRNQKVQQGLEVYNSMEQKLFANADRLAASGASGSTA